MKNIRKYGKEPFQIAVIHGGPGALGEMAPVAKELSKLYGVLEPFQTEISIDGQIQELKDLLETYGSLPFTLIGHSWGAWLAYIFASQYPEFVKKLILISSGPFEDKYVSSMEETRLNRFTDEEKNRINDLMKCLKDSNIDDKKDIWSEFGSLMSKVDNYSPIYVENDSIQSDVFFGNVINEAMILRKNGQLLDLGHKIKCPVVAIHGDYDPHPYLGVQAPLSNVLQTFQFFLLEKCGHDPWSELYAKDEFYRILKNELN